MSLSVWTKTILKQSIPKSIYDSAEVALGRKIRVINRQSLNDVQNQSNGSATLTKTNTFMTEVFKCFYLEKSAADIIPPTGMAFAESWVPYKKDKTLVVLFNFFSRNYGIRDPIYVRCVLMKNDVAVKSTAWIMTADSVESIDVKFDSEIESGTLLLQAFHPRIKTPGNQLRFYAFYRDSNNAVRCGVHSLPPPGQRDLALKVKTGLRAYSHSADATQYWTFNNAATPVDAGAAVGPILQKLEAKSPLVGHGFLTLTDGSGDLSGIWHDAPTSHFARVTQPSKKTAPLETTFTVPHFGKFTPVILFNPNQLGFECGKVKIKILSRDNVPIAEKVISLDKSVTAIDVGSLFVEERFAGHINVVLEFDVNADEFSTIPASMVQVYYKNATGFQDQVHSLHSIGFHSDLKPKLGSYRCRKFAPFLKGPNLECLYSIHSVGGVARKQVEQLKVRIFTDSGTEHILRFDVPIYGSLIIDSAAILKEAGEHIKNSAAVQIEHDSVNFGATWYVIDSTANSIAVDHFTGG